MSGSGSITLENSENGTLMKNKIRVYRAINEITQETLADAVKVSRQTILAIEKGKYTPSLDLAFKIARYFDISIEDLFQYEQTSETDE
jgi:putative transcriptional regulator